MTANLKKIEIFFLSIAVALLFLFVRLYDIASPSYWLDEMVSLHFAGHQYWKALFWDNHPPLYHLILKLWLHWFGYGELPVRLLSLLISFSSFVVLLRFLFKEVGSRSAFAISILYALSSAQIQMSQEARMYALFELASLVNLIQFYYFCQDPKRVRSYWLSVMFLAATHYLSVLQILIQFIYLAWLKKLPRFKIILGAALIWSAVVVFIFIDWKYLRWQDQSFQFSSFLQETHLFIKYIFFGSILACLSLIWLSVMGFKRAESNDQKILVLIPWLQFLSLILIQIFTHKNTLFVRYYEFLVPAFLISAFGFNRVQSLKKSWQIVLLATAILISSAAFLPEGIKQTKAPWRDVAIFIAKHPASVYTTRTLAVETPYFKARGIPVLRLENFAQIASKDEAYWLVESYFNGLAHLTQIQNDLEKLGKKSQLLQFRKNESDIVLVLAVNFKQAFDDAHWIEEVQSQEVIEKQDGMKSYF